MQDVKRYRRRQLVAELARLNPHLDPAEFERSAKLWPDHYLTYVFRDMTGKEIVKNPCGLWYSMVEGT